MVFERSAVAMCAYKSISSQTALLPGESSKDTTIDHKSCTTFLERRSPKESGSQSKRRSPNVALLDHSLPQGGTRLLDNRVVGVDDWERMNSLRLSGPGRKQLEEAIHSAFRNDENRFTRFVNIELAPLSHSDFVGGLRDRVHGVVGRLEDDRKLATLFAKLLTSVDTRQNDVVRQAVSRALTPHHLSVLDPNSSAVATEFGFNLAGDALEKLVRLSEGIIDAIEWRERYDEVLRSVCQIKTGTGSGTGVLVSKTHVLTSFHVIDGAADERIDLQFDFLKPGETSSASAKVVWDASCRSETDDHDFAFLELETEMSHRKPIPVARREPQEGEPIMLLQHPLAKHMGFSMGAVDTVKPDRTKHTANSQPGSSGGPCISAQFELLMLHRGANSDETNQAVPLSSIVAELGNDKANELGLRFHWRRTT